MHRVTANAYVLRGTGCIALTWLSCTGAGFVAMQVYQFFAAQKQWFTKAEIWSCCEHVPAVLGNLTQSQVYDYKAKQGRAGAPAMSPKPCTKEPSAL